MTFTFLGVIIAFSRSMFVIDALQLHTLHLHTKVTTPVMNIALVVSVGTTLLGSLIIAFIIQGVFQLQLSNMDLFLVLCVVEGVIGWMTGTKVARWIGVYLERV